MNNTNLLKKPLTEIKTKPKEHGSNNKKGIAGLWAKASEKRAVEKENRINEQKEEAQKVNQVVKKRVSKAQGSTSSLSKKRKRIQVISDSESGEEEENEEREDALRTQEAAPPPRKELESESEDEIPSTPTIQEPSTFTKKRKVRKLVKKQYVDDEGYMVTKEEYENKSEEEEKEEEGGRGNVIKSVITKPPPKSPKKMKETTAPKNKQASIMNFLKRNEFVSLL
nr:DNA polymerase delta subunit 3-like [Lepeophtheirus salmonis]